MPLYGTRCSRGQLPLPAHECGVVRDRRGVGLGRNPQEGTPFVTKTRYKHARIVSNPRVGNQVLFVLYIRVLYPRYVVLFPGLGPEWRRRGGYLRGLLAHWLSHPHVRPGRPRGSGRDVVVF